jgi:hypothetical protein
MREKQVLIGESVDTGSFVLPENPGSAQRQDVISAVLENMITKVPASDDAQYCVSLPVAEQESSTVFYVGQYPL